MPSGWGGSTAGGSTSTGGSPSTTRGTRAGRWPGEGGGRGGRRRGGRRLRLGGRRPGGDRRRRVGACLTPLAEVERLVPRSSDWPRPGDQVLDLGGAGQDGLRARRLQSAADGALTG